MVASALLVQVASVQSLVGELRSMPQSTVKHRKILYFRYPCWKYLQVKSHVTEMCSRNSSVGSGGARWDGCGKQNPVICWWLLRRAVLGCSWYILSLLYVLFTTVETENADLQIWFNRNTGHCKFLQVQYEMIFYFSENMDRFDFTKIGNKK